MSYNNMPHHPYLKWGKRGQSPVPNLHITGIHYKLLTRPGFQIRSFLSISSVLIYKKTYVL